MTWEIRAEIARFRPQRLVIDSMADLEAIAGDERHLRGYVLSLAGTLRNAGVTKEVAQIVGPELDFSGTPLAVLAENLLLMRYVEFRGELYSILSILKIAIAPTITRSASTRSLDGTSRSWPASRPPKGC